MANTTKYFNFIGITLCLYTIISSSASNGAISGSEKALQQSTHSCKSSLTSSVEFFPAPITYDDEKSGFVTDQIQMTKQSLIEAYSKGIFPWIDRGDKADWFSPPERGVIFLDEAFKRRQTRRDVKKAAQLYTVTFDRAFKEVIEACATVPRKDEEGQATGTWITPTFIQNYLELFKSGNAHSVEVWQGEELVGGLYGVLTGGVFSGESMFSKADNASKLALASLIERLKEKGHHFIDSQQVSETTRRMGGRYITREEFLDLKAKEAKSPKPF